MVIRGVVCDILQGAGMQVVGVASDGEQAVRLCREHNPDVLTLDLAMPGMGGMEVLARLGAMESPVRVVVVSAFIGGGAERAVDALSAGAVTAVPKPTGGITLTEFQDDLVEKVRLAADAVSVVAWPAHQESPQSTKLVEPPARRLVETAPRRPPMTGKPVLVIACSTGGPRALAEIVPLLPASLGGGAVIVQHMPQGFTAHLAARLDASSSIAVREARDGDMLDPGTLLMAPAGHHLRMGEDRRFRLDDSAPIGALKPRADLLIDDLANVYGDRVILAVLTGMGKDGLLGARAVHAAGGRIIAQGKAGCVVYGMSRSIVEAGLADTIEPLEAIASRITTDMGARPERTS